MSLESPVQKVLDNLHGGKIAFLSESATLTVNQRVVEVDSSGGAVTITLPNVGEAAGKSFSIHAPNGLTNAVTVTDGAGGSKLFGGDYALNANNDAIMLLSDGVKWWAIANEIA